MSGPNSSSKSPSRRVLGDLTPKAINTPTKHAYALDPSRSHSPLKQVQTLSPQLFRGAENMPPGGAFKPGRKRSIYEVDCADHLERAERMYGRAEEALLQRGEPVTAAALRERTVFDNDLFEGSPTEPNTPSHHEDEPNETLELPDNSQDTQASKNSFSSIFDFPAAAQLSFVEAEREPADEPAKKKTKAELLRLSLGIGMYKVKTGQVNKRGKDIIATWETSTSSHRSMEASSFDLLNTSADSSTSVSVPSVSITEPSHVVANLDPFRPIGKLGPGPVLLPTSISSRMIYDQHVPSSPPISISPELIMSPVRAISNFRTPVPHKTRIVDEDYEDEEVDVIEFEGTAGEHLRLIREQRFEEGDLTSSAVKGHAAKGLLELMTSRR